MSLDTRVGWLVSRSAACLSPSPLAKAANASLVGAKTVPVAVVLARRYASPDDCAWGKRSRRLWQVETQGLEEEQC